MPPWPPRLPDGRLVQVGVAGRGGEAVRENSPGFRRLPGLLPRFSSPGRAGGERCGALVGGLGALAVGAQSIGEHERSDGDRAGVDERDSGAALVAGGVLVRAGGQGGGALGAADHAGRPRAGEHDTGPCGQVLAAACGPVVQRGVQLRELGGEPRGGRGQIGQRAPSGLYRAPGAQGSGVGAVSVF